VREEGDAAKTFGLALRAEHAVGGVKPHQLRVSRRVDLGGDLDLVALAGERHDQVVTVETPGINRLTIDHDLEWNQAVPVETKVGARQRLGVAVHGEGGTDSREVQPEIEFEP